MSGEGVGLVAFLRARLAGDEHYAYQAKGLMGIENAWWTWTALKERFPTLSRGDAQHIERHGPYRVLRGVAAKRRIVDAYAEVAEFYQPDPAERYEIADGNSAALHDAACALAAEWSDHPDYKKSWVGSL